MNYLVLNLSTNRYEIHMYIGKRWTVGDQFKDSRDYNAPIYRVIQENIDLCVIHPEPNSSIAHVKITQS